MKESRQTSDRREIHRRCIDRREKHINVNEEHRHKESRRINEERRKLNRRNL